MPFTLKRSFREILGSIGDQSDVEEQGDDKDELAGDLNGLEPDINKRRRFVSRALSDKGRTEVVAPSAIGGYDRVHAERDATSLTRNTRTPCVIGTPSEGTPNQLKEVSLFDDRNRLMARLDNTSNVQQFSHIRVPGPDVPLSAHRGWQPKVERCSEAAALREVDMLANGEYVYMDLDQFSVYRPSVTRTAWSNNSGAQASRHSLELCTLDKLNGINAGTDTLVFDGIVSCKGKRLFLQGVRFRIMSIDGYGEVDPSNISRSIFLQSERTRGTQIWYRLGSPSPEYHRFFSPFLWLAQFARFFVAYLQDTPGVAIRHFRNDFHAWVHNESTDGLELRVWQRQANTADFRTTVSANIGFLYSECYGLQDRPLVKHPIWSEVNPYALGAICENLEVMPKTVVTPFTKDCFEDMYFASHLETLAPQNGELLRVVQERKVRLGLTPFKTIAERATHDTTKCPQLMSTPKHSVSKGDIVCIAPDTSTDWSKSTANIWYAYVQGLRGYGEKRKMELIWLYEPCDTTIGKATYPFPNELFLSDNCACGWEALRVSHVLSTVQVEWRPEDPATCTSLFVRQKFRTIHEEDSYDFVTVKQSDFTCSCSVAQTSFEACCERYGAGDTVLYRSKYSTYLEPAKLCDFDRPHQRVIVQPFVRSRRSDSQAPPNELAFGSENIDITAGSIVRACYIRGFQSRDAVHCPYNRQGAGDYWYFLEDDTTPQHVSSLPPLKQAWDPTVPSQQAPLTGLSIFSGGGSFDRGLEEGGAVKFKHAVDLATHALHTYRANIEDPTKVNFFLGSVNDYLAGAMKGCLEAASIGSIDLISAGSPCPGFSSLQINKLSEASLRNASMVASVVAFADLYSPKYLVLENVINLTRGMGANKDENVFSVIIASLVGLGYQVQQFLMDAWSYGSCQSRSRIFIIASAPGREPLPPPPHTHSQHAGKLVISLGQSSNGLSFGTRQGCRAPMPTSLPEVAFHDLPDIADGQVDLCPSAPDHRTPTRVSYNARSIITAIPVLPRGMGYVQAHLAGFMQGRHANRYQELNGTRQAANSNYYSRIYPNGLFPTVTTAHRMGCARSGRTIHWEQHRSCTVMELRRVQGFLDHEVIVGTPAQQVRIIGNSVDRHVAFALGQSLRETWLKSPVEEHGSGIAAAVVDGAVKAVQTVVELFQELPASILPSNAAENPPESGRLVGTCTDLNPIDVGDGSSEEDEEAEELRATTDRPNSPAVIIPHLNHISVPPPLPERSRATSADRSDTGMSENITVANGWDLIGKASTPSIDESASGVPEVLDSAMTTPDVLPKDREHYRVGSASMRTRRL